MEDQPRVRNSAANALEPFESMLDSLQDEQSDIDVAKAGICINFEVLSVHRGMCPAGRPIRDEDLERQARRSRIGSISARICGVVLFAILSAASVSIGFSSVLVFVMAIPLGYGLSLLSDCAVSLATGASPRNPDAAGRIRRLVQVACAVVLLSAVGFLWLRFIDDPSLQQLVSVDFVA